VITPPKRVIYVEITLATSLPSHPPPVEDALPKNRIVPRKNSTLAHKLRGWAIVDLNLVRFSPRIISTRGRKKALIPKRNTLKSWKKFAAPSKAPN
jgi:hypothetical protein